MASWLQLAGRTAIVTGAGSGIGKCVAELLLKQGCNVVLADLDLDRERPPLRSSFDDKGKTSVAARAHNIRCDVTDSAQVQSLFRSADEIASNAEGIPSVAGILVNCAGITRDSFISKMEEDDFDSVINVNLKGTFLTCKYFAESSRLETLKSTSNDGSIINIGSVVGTYGNIGQTNYAASKGGVVSMTRSLAKELSKYNVRSNTVLPGFIHTPMTDKVPEKILAQMVEKISLRKFGDVEDVANLVLFLASEKSKFITGESIECSGLCSL